MEHHSSDKVRILLADPDTLFCVRLRRVLERHGCAVTIAHDGNDLLSRFSPDHFDGIIAGVTLPSPNGLDILRQIHKTSPGTRVFLLCDEQSVKLAKSGVAEGALTYFSTTNDDLEEMADTITSASEADVELPSPNQDSELEPESEPSLQAIEAEANSFSLDALLTRLSRDLIESSASRPLEETMQVLADAGAQVLEADHGMVLLTQPTGMQIVTQFDSEAEMVHDFLVRANDGFAYRVASARKTLIDAVAADTPGGLPLQFLGTPLIVKDRVVGVLIVYPLASNQSVNLARVIWMETLATLGALAVEIARLKQENSHLSPNDPVTGAIKRSSFLEMADREFRRSWRYNHPIALIVIDIDDMSAINMMNGQEFGDVVLREVAAVCHNIVRSVDVVGRYDADSIATLLLMTGKTGAKVVAERLRAGISAIQLAGSHGPVSVSATFGVCTYPRDDCASIFDLINASQEAQRNARRQGPNRIMYA